MASKLKTIAVSITFSGMLAVASMALAQQSQTPSEDGQTKPGMMPGGMSGGIVRRYAADDGQLSEDDAGRQDVELVRGRAIVR